MKQRTQSIKTDVQLESLKLPPGKTRIEVADALCPGLRIRVGARAKTFVWYVHTDDGKRKVYTLGKTPHMSLAQARQELRRLRDAKSDTGSAPEDLTIEDIVVEYLGLSQPLRDYDTIDDAIAEVVKSGHLETRGGDVLRAPEKPARTLLKDVVPRIGKVRARQLRAGHVSRMVADVKTRGKEPGRLALLYTRTVCGYAIGQSYMEDNPAAGIVPSDLKVARGKKDRRTRIPMRGEVADLIELLTDKDRCPLDFRTSCAIRTLLFFGIRTGETVGARWGEVSFPRRTWTVPGERRKNGTAITYPIPEPALRMLQELYRVTGGSGSNEIFGIDRRALGRAMTRLQQPRGATKTPLWNTNGEQINPHDFRRLFRSTAQTKNLAAKDVIRFQMGHSIASDSQDETYDVGTLITERTALLDAWANCITNPRVELLDDEAIRTGVMMDAEENIADIA
ncbi:MAG: integrase [Halieaceae bacterium]|jgi:integrase